MDKLSEKKILGRLELSRKEAKKGNYKEANIVLKDIRKKYDL